MNLVKIVPWEYETQFVPLKTSQPSGADRGKVTRRGQCPTEKHRYWGVRKGFWQDAIPESPGRIWVSSRKERTPALWGPESIRLCTVLWFFFVDIGNCPRSLRWVRTGYFITFLLSWNEKQASYSPNKSHTHVFIKNTKQKHHAWFKQAILWAQWNPNSLLFWMLCLLP